MSEQTEFETKLLLPKMLLSEELGVGVDVHCANMTLKKDCLKYQS